MDFLSWKVSRHLWIKTVLRDMCGEVMRCSARVQPRVRTTTRAFCRASEEVSAAAVGVGAALLERRTHAARVVRLWARPDATRKFHWVMFFGLLLGLPRNCREEECGRESGCGGGISTGSGRCSDLRSPSFCVSDLTFFSHLRWVLRCPPEGSATAPLFLRRRS